MCPYLWTECSNAFFTVDPFIWTKSKVPPNGKTVRISSIVMEPKSRGKYHNIVAFVVKHSVILEKNHWSTVFVALIYRCPYGPTIQHTYANMIPLQLTWILDIMINLTMQKGKTCYTAVKRYRLLLGTCCISLPHTPAARHLHKLPRNAEHAQTGLQPERVTKRTYFSFVSVVNKMNDRWAMQPRLSEYTVNEWMNKIHIDCNYYHSIADQVSKVTLPKSALFKRPIEVN